MAHTITRKVIQNGDRDYISLFVATSDGASGELSNVMVNAVSGDVPVSASFIHLTGGTNGGAAFKLSWDATTKVDFLSFPKDHANSLDYQKISGIHNAGGAGVTGNIDITTTGFGTTAGTCIAFTMKLHKQ